MKGGNMRILYVAIAVCAALSIAWFSQSGTSMVIDQPQSTDANGKKGDIIAPHLTGAGGYPANQRDIVSLRTHTGDTYRLLSAVDDTIGESGDMRLDTWVTISRNNQTFIEQNGGSAVWSLIGGSSFFRMSNFSGTSYWRFDQETTARGLISVWDRSIQGNGVPLILAAQSVLPNVPGHGGRLELAGGERGQAAYNKGGVQLKVGGWGQDEVLLECVESSPGHRVTAVNAGMSYNPAWAGADSGDLVTHVLPSDAAPTAPPATGALLYVDPADNKLKAWRAGAAAPAVLTP